MQRLIGYLQYGKKYGASWFFGAILCICFSAQSQASECAAEPHYFSRLSNALAAQHITAIEQLQTDLNAQCTGDRRAQLQPIADASTLYLALIYSEVGQGDIALSEKSQGNTTSTAEAAATRLLSLDFGQISVNQQAVYYPLLARYLLYTNQHKRALTLTHILSHELLEQLPPQEQAAALLALANIHFDIEFYQSVRELLSPLLQHSALHVRISAATTLWYAPQNQAQLNAVLEVLKGYDSLPDTFLKVSALEVLARQSINDDLVPIAQQYLNKAHRLASTLNAKSATYRLWFIEAKLPESPSHRSALSSLLSAPASSLSMHQQHARLDMQITQRKAAEDWQATTELLLQAQLLSQQIDRNKALAREYASFQMVEQAKAINQAKQQAQMQALAARNQQQLQTIYILALICAALALIIVTLLWVRKRKAAVHFEHLANTDGLTKVLNRRAIQYYAEQALKRCKHTNEPFVIALADIDHFKSVNDTYGHDAGDIVLTTFAERTNALIRQQDKLGRWGGEEWLIVMTNTTIDAVEGLFARMQSEVKTVQTNEHTLTITFSMGAVQGSSSDTIEALINTADQRLYYAKENGRNRLETAQ